jgi:uncharacterized protein YbjT (DUF2867 family)
VEMGNAPVTDAGAPTLVIGGTRGTGFLIVQLLHRQGSPVRVLARNPARAAITVPRGVDVVAGDLTRRETLPPAIEGARHIIFTAGVRSGRSATEERIKATEYDGVLNVLEAAKRAGFQGRFLYMTASGVARRSLSAFLLNLYKGNTLVWRRRAEGEIRRSGVDYTIIRAGVLLNRQGGQRAVEVRQVALPLSLRYRIARADVAEAFVAALDHPRASRATFEIFWGKGPRQEDWTTLLNGLRPDTETVV